jgi:hypothetical protein
MLPPITEKEFLDQIVQLGNLHGWRSFHVFDSRKSAPGFPDLIMLRGQRMIVAELKRSGKFKPSAYQCAWLAAFMQLQESFEGLLVAVWDPSMWPEIERTLQ